jgi:eukaryotic-like serine/threonine-protein kinase
MREPGEWIHGKYQVQRVLGTGGMGTVYGTKRRNESQAAVKVLHPRFARDKSIRARFLEEGYLANRVGHPAVVTIIEDDIDEEGNFYIVMELLDGVDLAQFVGPPRIPVTTAQTLNIADQLLAALVQAHQKGIVHRDIKPANVMILRDGRVKLLDFGIAKALSAMGTVSALEEDEEGTIGTDRYMSPEQGNGLIEDIDARSDLWSVGALLMALLAEQDSSTIPLWDQNYEDRAWSFSRLGPDVPPLVVQIISLALQPQKDQRWVSAAAMKEAVASAHLNLYGPITREELALLVKGRLSSPAEAPYRFEDEVPLRVTPVPIDPTVLSRPSQAAPSAPRASRPSMESDSSPPLAPDSLASAPSRAGGHLRLLALGTFLFGLGVLAALALSKSNAPPAMVLPEGAPSLAVPHAQSSASSGPTDLAARGAAPSLESEPVLSPSATRSADINVQSTLRTQELTTSASQSSAAERAPTRSPSTQAGTPDHAAKPAASRPNVLPPATANPERAPDPGCNGLDGIFNVKECN